MLKAYKIYYDEYETTVYINDEDQLPAIYNEVKKIYSKIKSIDVLKKDTLKIEEVNPYDEITALCYQLDKQYSYCHKERSDDCAECGSIHTVYTDIGCITNEFPYIRYNGILCYYFLSPIDGEVFKEGEELKFYKAIL